MLRRLGKSINGSAIIKNFARFGPLLQNLNYEEKSNPAAPDTFGEAGES